MPNIGDPVPTPRVKRSRPRDAEAMAAVDALLASPEGTSVPVTGFADEEDARRFGGRVQGYAARDHDISVSTSFNRDNQTLYLTIGEEEREHISDDDGDHPAIESAHPES